MDLSSLKRIERLNYLLGGVLIAASAFVFTREGAMGVVVGVVLSCINFSVMRSMVQSWVRLPPGRRSSRSLIMLPKMTGLILAVFLAIRFLPISGMGLAIGFSVFLPSIAVETVRYISNPPMSDTSDDSSASDAEK